MKQNAFFPYRTRHIGGWLLASIVGLLFGLYPYLAAGEENNPDKQTICLMNSLEKATIRIGASASANESYELSATLPNREPFALYVEEEALRILYPVGKITIRAGEEALHLPKANLYPVGKITARNDPWARPRCTATLIAGNIILTAAGCVQDTVPFFFFPGSNSDNHNPYGRAYLTNYIDTALGTQLGVLRSFPQDAGSIETNIDFSSMPDARYDFYFRWVCPGKFPEQWKHGNYFVLVGYLKNGNLSPYIQTGVAVESVDDNIIHLDSDAEVENFLPGAQLFAYLCGFWGLVAIKPAHLDNRLISICPLVKDIAAAYDCYGSNLKPVPFEGCRRPSPSRGQLKFPATPLPRR